MSFCQWSEGGKGGGRKLANKSAWRGGASRVVSITRRLPIARIIPYNNRGTLHHTSDLCRPIVRGKKSRRGPPSVERPGPAAVFSRRYYIGTIIYKYMHMYIGRCTYKCIILLLTGWTRGYRAKTVRILWIRTRETRRSK